MARNAVTIRDVALHAGVSVGTASKAFNRTGRLAEETRCRVLQAARTLNYAPNALIRSLQRGKTHTIGVLSWSLSTEVSRDVTMQLLIGITDGIAAAGFDTLLYSRLPERGDPPSAVTFMDGRADGVIIGPQVISDSAFEDLAASGPPAIVLYREPTLESLGCVRIDNGYGIAQAIDHLLALGHRKIAFHAPDSSFDYRERRAAYLQGLKRHGLPANPAWNMVMDNFHAPIRPTCDRLLALEDRPTALLTGDDHLALHWLEELRRRRVRVPEDLSLVGFDDTLAARGEACLTTIRQPAQQVGQTAAELVRCLIDGGPVEVCRVVLPVQFIARATTGPPGAGS